MRRIPALLAAVLLVSGCANSLVLTPDDAIAVVPYHVGETGQIIVTAAINGQGPFNFAIDTGASITVIFDRAREQAGFKLLEDKRVLIHGMVGSGHFPLAVVEEIAVGDASWDNARIAVMPGDTDASTSVDGILGVDLLSHYAIAFSSGQELVRFHCPKQVADRSYRGWTSIPLQKLRIGSGEATAYAIDLSIGGNRIPALFDLGASENLINWKAARAVGVRPVRTQRHSTVYGAVDSAPVAAQLNVGILRITDLYWRNLTFLIADLPIFEVLELDGRPTAIVGAGLFVDREFVVDFVRERLLVRSLK